MEQPATLTKLKEAIQVRFPRASAEWLASIDDNVIDWTTSLSQEYPYWFLSVEPGNLLSESTFPLNLATLPTRGPAGSQWVDSGFLVTVPGQATYDFYHPTDYDAFLANPTYPSALARCQIQEVDYVLEFNASNGSYRTILDTKDMAEGLGFSSYSQHRRPVQCMWRNTETRSQLTFQPTPAEASLYAVGFVIKSPPWYQLSGSGEYYNRWLTFAPEALTLYGLIKACEHFNEPGMLQMYQMQLYGTPAKAGRSHGASNQYVGELGKMKRETARRREKMYAKVSWYESQAEAQRAGNGMVYPSAQSRLRFIMPQYRRGMY